VLLNELVRSLQEPVRAAESYAWTEAEPRLTVNNALLAGVRKIGEPPSDAALAFDRKRAAGQIERDAQLLLPTLVSDSAAGGLQSLSRSVDAPTSARVFAAAKARGTTFTAVHAATEGPR